jgi:hypothetical protein
METSKFITSISLIYKKILLKCTDIIDIIVVASVSEKSHIA